MDLTPDGLPITLQVYPGNILDHTTAVQTGEQLAEVLVGESQREIDRVYNG